MTRFGGGVKGQATGKAEARPAQDLRERKGREKASEQESVRVDTDEYKGNEKWESAT
jgi:hypothetical protein